MKTGRKLRCGLHARCGIAFPADTEAAAHFDSHKQVPR